MPGIEMSITAPDKLKHANAILDLTSKVFSGWIDYFKFRDRWKNRICYGHYDWSCSRIGIRDGQIVTHFGVWGYETRIGAARIRTGGIGVVATHADFRKKGLIAKTANASLYAMRKMGYDMTILFGIDDFYDRYGYVRAWSDESYMVRTADLPNLKSSVKLNKFVLKQRDDWDRIYNHENSAFTGTAVRPTYIRDSSPMPAVGYLWKNAGGKMAGYVIVNTSEKEFCCHEHGGRIDQVLSALASIALRRGQKNVKFTGVHFYSPLGKTLRRSNCRIETVHKKCGDAMVHLLNLETTLRKMTGELSDRLKKSHMSGWKGNLLISNAREKVLLRIERSGITLSGPGNSRHSIRGKEEIAQLILGTDEPEEIIESARIRLTGDAVELSRILFPNQRPSLAPWDMY